MRIGNWIAAFSLATAALPRPAGGADWYFDGSGGDREWSNPANWYPNYNGIPGGGTYDRANTVAGWITPLLGPGDSASVGRIEIRSTQSDGFEIAGGSLSVVFDIYVRNGGYLKFSSGSVTVGTSPPYNHVLKVGEGAGATFEMTGGSLSTTRFVGIGGNTDYANATGTWLMKGGEATIATDLVIPMSNQANGHGILDMTGGSIWTTWDFYVAPSRTDSTAEIYLQGGTINTRNLQWGLGTITFDISGDGTLIDRGDARGAAYLELITYSVTKGDGQGVRSVEYDAQNNRTIIRSLPRGTVVVIW